MADQDPERKEPLAMGSDWPEDTEFGPGEEPVATGTFFLMIVFLMLIFGFWVMMYVLLLGR